MQPVLFDILLISVTYLVGMTLPNTIFFHRLHHTTSAIGSTVYFLILSVGAGIAFWKYAPNLLLIGETESRTALVWLSILLLLMVLLGRTNHMLKLGKQNPKVKIFTPDSMFILSKSAEILFQQVCVFLLISALYVMYPDITLTAIAYGIVFAALHIPILVFLGRLGWLFVGGAALSALFFPYTILMFENGFVYSYVLHWCFYIVVFFAAYIYGFYPRNRSTKK